ncbi:class I SAM-dependent methyltransferase [Streptomyces uncialis]|uniref:SAM-dependent methyltransferase n=2 Tax=Streptomyces uncialis TaxID=1048205 RepID=A0A1Q4V792_9ACTN|nr:class I SAM-dependent methyltransferase [Streptomyces uncialis]OKH93684.1 SAM-dependent methyltransferase [Streptomyces uncialis]
MDWSVMGPYIERGGEVSAPVYREAARWIAGSLPRPGRVLDVGSGPGVVACLLAEVFEDAEVIAVDPEEALLELARERAAREGLADRVRTVRAELPDGLDGLPPADLLWLGRSLHHVGDQRAALASAARRLAPGGVLALLEGGLPSRSLPRDLGFGRPALESRMDAVEQDWFSAMRDALPGSRSETEDWPALLESAGLRPAGTRTFLLDRPAPLTAQERDFVVASFERRREAMGDSLDAADLATLDRLVDAGDPAGLRNRPDLHLLTAQTVHTAVAAPRES